MTYFESCPECGASDYTVIADARNAEGSPVRTELLQCTECGAAWDAIPGAAPRQGSAGHSAIQVKPSSPKS